MVLCNTFSHFKLKKIRANTTKEKTDTEILSLMLVIIFQPSFHLISHCFSSDLFHALNVKQGTKPIVFHQGYPSALYTVVPQAYSFQFSYKNINVIKTQTNLM